MYTRLDNITAQNLTLPSLPPSVSSTTAIPTVSSAVVHSEVGQLRQGLQLSNISVQCCMQCTILEDTMCAISSKRFQMRVSCFPTSGQFLGGRTTDANLVTRRETFQYLASRKIFRSEDTMSQVFGHLSQWT